MVMEATPSPQSVGREFVRQYYTLLNKAPAHLHRFYNNYSSFVHGGLDAPSRESPPVVGQKQIHNRIQQLNFRDCHAKISQVDAQATLGSGVVVQVTGELSNAGAPMRRFTQTFVLAAQSPKKYYVHNDIFRYQDIVFSDEEGSNSARSDGEEEAYFPPPPAAPFPAPFPAPPAAAAAAAAALNGHVEEPAAPAPAPRDDPPPPREPSPQPPPPQPVAVEAPPSPSPPEPKTYANLLKSHPRPAPALAPAPAPAAPPAPAPAPAAPPPLQQLQQSPPAPARARLPRDALPPADGAVRARYPDSHQLFLGNVPWGAAEADVRSVFARYGAVAELRLHGGGAARGPGAGAGAAGAGPARTPSYGFVTFESPQAAQDCLADAPLYLEWGGDSVKLNVEEKKARGGRVERRRPPRR